MLWRRKRSSAIPRPALRALGAELRKGYGSPEKDLGPPPLKVKEQLSKLDEISPPATQPPDAKPAAQDPVSRTPETLRPDWVGPLDGTSPQRSNQRSALELLGHLLLASAIGAGMGWGIYLTF